MGLSKTNFSNSKYLPLIISIARNIFVKLFKNYAQVLCVKGRKINLKLKFIQLFKINTSIINQNCFFDPTKS